MHRPLSLFVLVALLTLGALSCESRRRGLSTSSPAHPTSSTIGAATSSTTSSQPSGQSAPAAVTSLVVVGAPLVSGDASIAFRITDATSALADALVDWSRDGGLTWSPATLAGGAAALNGLATGAGLGVEHTAVWSSAVDVPTTASVVLRVELRGGTGLASAPFTVDNQPLVNTVQLTRYPYLQRTTKDSVLVAWHTDVPTDSVIELGETPALGRVVVASGSSRVHAVEIGGLQPGTRYHYRILTGGLPLTRRLAFATAPDSAVAEMTFLVFGDSGNASADQMAVAARMTAEQDVDVVIHTGDLIYNIPSRADMVEQYDLKFFQPYRDLLHRAPIFPVPGNHEREDFPNYYASYQESFYLPGNGTRLFDEWFYSFEWGDVKFVMVETSVLGNWPVGAHVGWLQNELQTNQRKWLIVVQHHPLYWAGASGSGLVRQAIMEPLYENNGVDLVLAGHKHRYERTVPIRQYNRANGYPGLVHLITGGGGAHMTPHSPGPQSAGFASVHHYLKLRIQGDRLFGEAIDLNGQQVDAFVIQNQ